MAHQILLSIGLPRQEYWSGLPSPSPGELLDPGIEAASLISPVLAGSIFTTSVTWEAHMVLWLKYISIKLEEKKVKLIKNFYLTTNIKIILFQYIFNIKLLR